MSFQSDITIITNSKEFRRMQDKTQLFYARKSDHYRTRLTHTLEVCDIALQIAENLRRKYCDGDKNIKDKYSPCSALDDKLITAIAYGHDIGHTPFGHVGERVLNDILDGTDSLGGLINKENILKQGFKHNINSFRILMKDDYSTLDSTTISWQTLDGALKHTKVYKYVYDYKDLDESVRMDPYQIKKAGSKGILSGGNAEFNKLRKLKVKATKKNFDYYQHNFALTIEGQIVAIADEIAQRVSDFDDAVRAGFWMPTKNDFILHDSEILFYKNYSTVIDALNNFEYASKNMTEICERLRDFLISDVDFFPENSDPQRFNGQEIYFGKCIDFSNNHGGADANKIFDNINRNYIIKCKEIRKCDGISKHVIRQLFKAYYNDFSQLSDACLITLYHDLSERAKHIINSKNNKFLTCGKISLDHIKDIEKKIIFIKAIKDADLQNDSTEIANKLKKVSDSHANLFNELMGNKLGKQNALNNESQSEEERNIRKNWLKELHSIILRNIVFFIAGMTDSFARDEYQRLYSIKMPMNTY